MSWITQGFIIAASISVITASTAVVYAILKGRTVVEQRLTELDMKTKTKKAELARLVDAAASMIKD